MMTPPSLTATITDRTLTRRLTLDGLRLVVDRYSFAVEGGPKKCVIKAYGDEKALRNLFTAIRGGVQILDNAGEAVWWGCLWSVVIHGSATKYGKTIDGMANKIDILYLLQSVNQSFSGSGSQATTGYSSDTQSVAEYGTIERRIRGSNGSSTAATARQARELETRKNPQSIFAVAKTAEPYALLECRGWFETLGFRYWSNNSGNAAGFEQNTVTTSEAVQGMGRRLAPVATDYTFTSNNTVSKSYANMLTALGSYLFFTGSTSNNNKDWLISKNTGAGGAFEVTPTTVTTESAGASVSLWEMGQKIYQTFTVTTEFYAAAIDIRLAKYGTPADNVVIKLYTDSGSVTPNTLQATATISNASIGTSVGWLTGVLDSQVQLAVGTTYGIEISRSGTSTGVDGFQVGVDTATSYANGALRLYGNATIGWKARPTNADLIFKVAGVVETTTQITSIIAGVGEFVTSTTIDNTSGLRLVPYQDGTRTAKQVISDLLQYGTSDNYRLFGMVDINRSLVIRKETTYGTSADVLVQDDGLPRRLDGSLIPPHRCPYGVWVRFAPLEFMADADKYLFVDEAEYVSASNEWRVVRTKDRASELDLLKLTE